MGTAETLRTIGAVAAGGAVGAVGRYLAMVAVGHALGTGFPFATLVVNVAGSFALGLLVEAMALFITIGPDFRAFLVVGTLGAFTTFSTFSMDAVLLFERGAPAQAFVYMAGSVILCVGAFFLAMRLVRAFA